MLTIENPKVSCKKSTFKAKLIQKILLDDDVLKIEYLNKHGEHTDVTLTSANHPDISDIEIFLGNVVHGYKNGKFNESFLMGFGKSIYYQLTKLIDPDYTGFGKMKSIRFGRFVIEQAFEGIVGISIAQKI